MKSAFFRRGVSAVCAGIFCASSAPAWGKSAKEVFAEVARSVVVVLALDSSGETSSQGSGVVVGKNEVATNCHVIDRAAKVVVRQALESDIGQSYRMDAAILARDDERDLCLLFVGELSEPPAAPIVKMGAAKALSIGEEIFAIGAPKGLDLSLSRGIVSQLRRLGDRQTAPFVQTDAAISPGSSGGGLFNDEGLLVGITTFKRVGGENLNFAIPAEWVGDLREMGWAELKALQKRGECLINPDYKCVIAAALFVARSIDDVLGRADALRGIASAQAQAGDIDGALSTTRSIDYASFRIWALHNIALAQAEAGAIDGALSTARSIDDANIRTRALRGIASAQAEAGDIDGALSTARSINDEGVRADALRGIVSAQAEAGDIDGALSTVRSIDNANTRIWTLRDIALVQAEAGDIDGALSTARSIDDANARTRALRDIEAMQAEPESIDDALDTTRSIDNAGNRALSDTASEQAKAGNFQIAMKIAMGIEEIDDRVKALASVAKHLAARERN